MAFELRLPDIGEGVAEGEIVRWLVAEGASVKEDDLLVEVLTDKANIEIPSPLNGVLARILAKPGQIVKVGEVIALIEAAGAIPTSPATPSRAPAGALLATPVVRKLAKDLGVDLSKVTGTGPGGGGTGGGGGAAPASPDEERGEIVLKRYFNIGMAVDAEDGLVVPVIRDAGEKTIVELAREIEHLSEGARTGKLSVFDLSGGTFTVTSIGSIGGLFRYPVIHPPGAALLRLHKIVRRPVVRGGEIVERDMMYLSLSFDHRLIDGGAAAPAGDRCDT